MKEVQKYEEHLKQMHLEKKILERMARYPVVAPFLWLKLWRIRTRRKVFALGSDIEAKEQFVNSLKQRSR